MIPRVIFRRSFSLGFHTITSCLGKSLPSLRDKHCALITSVNKPSRAQLGQFGPYSTLPYTTSTITLLYPTLPHHITPYPTLPLPLPYFTLTLSYPYHTHPYPVPSFTKKTQITGKTTKYRKDHSMIQKAFGK